MPKLKLAALQTVAKQEGFSGDVNDIAAMRKHLLEHPSGAVTEIDGEDGTVYAVKDCEIDVPAPTTNAKAARKVRVAGTVVSENQVVGLPPDFDEKVKALAKQQAKEMLSAAGYKFKDNDFTPIRPGEIGNVKTGEHRWYDDRIKSGKAAFSSYGQAECWRRWIASKFAAKSGNFAQAQELATQAGEMAEQITGHSKALDTVSVTGGAATVPELFQPDLIKLVNQFGVFRELTRVYELNTTQLVLPRQTGSVTPYWPTQNTAITQSNQTYDNVTLNAQTAAVLVQSSMQLLQASGLNIADETASEISRILAQTMDQCLLIGNGSATYGGMFGFDKKFGTAASDGGYQVVGGDSMDAHTHAQLVSCIARLPSYAVRGGRCKWTCSRAAKGLIFDRLATSTNVGGLLKTEVTASGPVTYYMGYPIVVNDVMNTTNSLGATKYDPTFTAGDAPDILFGDFEAASKMLLFKNVAIDMSSERYFDQYAMAFRGVVQFDVNVHDVGTASVAGPVVSFWQT